MTDESNGYEPDQFVLHKPQWRSSGIAESVRNCKGIDATYVHMYENFECISLNSVVKLPGNLRHAAHGQPNREAKETAYAPTNLG